MKGDTSNEPTPHLRERCKSFEELQTDRSGETVGLDGEGDLYGDGEPVEKADPDGDSRADADPVDGLADELRAHAEAARPDSLSKEALAKDAGDRPERALSPEAIQQSLHDQGLSTKEAVLEVRDELRDLRMEGVAVTGDGSVSKDADDGSGTDTDADTDADADGGQGDGPKDTGPSLAPDDPVPEAVDELAERDPALTKALGVPLDGEGTIPERRREWARHRYALAKHMARGGA